MKGSGTTIMLRELHEMQGKSISEIARELGMSRSTVRKCQRPEVAQKFGVGLLVAEYEHRGLKRAAGQMKRGNSSHSIDPFAHVGGSADDVKSR